MYFHYQRSYRGPVQAVILDWAGTTVDFGSLAPVAAFTRLFAAQGIDLGLDEARGPMDTEKREHIRRLCALPRITAAWRDLYGESPDEATIDRLYQEFVPLQVAAICDHAHRSDPAPLRFQQRRWRQLGLLRQLDPAGAVHRCVR